MADEPNVFEKIVKWFKEASDWVQQNFGDPEIATALREDLGLKPGADLSPADKAKFVAFKDGLDPDKVAFDATVAEIAQAIEGFIQLGETLKDPASGDVAWDIAYLLGNIALADTLRVRFPAIYALGKLGLLVSDDPDAVEQFDPAMLMKILRGETPQDASQMLYDRVSHGLSLIPTIVDILLQHFDKTGYVDYFYGWDPIPGSPTPLADIASARTLTMLLGPGEGLPRAAVTMAGVPDTDGGRGMILSLGGDFKEKFIGTDGLEADFHIGAAGALSLYIPFGSQGGDLRADGSPDVFFKLGVAKVGKAGKPAFTIGEATESRLEFGKIGAGVEIANDRAAVLFSISNGALVITPGKADSFLKKILSDDIRVGFNLRMKVDSQSGLTFEGGTGIAVTIPIEKTIAGALTIHHITMALGPSSRPQQDLALEASGAFGVKLGPFQASVDRLGFTLDMAFREGNLGFMDLSLGFKPPNGLGLLLDATVVKGGGYLYIDPAKGEYAGVLELKIDLPAVKIGIKAIGVLTTKMPDGSDGWALLLLIYGQFPPIQLSWGFTLTGLGGMIGLQHGVSIDALISGMSSGVLDDILFPANPVADAPRIINRLRTVFPVTPRALVLGPMVEIGWGTPNIVTIRMGVLLQLDNALGQGDQPISFSRVAILGQVLAQLPPGVKADLTVLKLLVDFVGSIEVNPFRIGFVARLRDSYAGKKPLKIDFGGMLVVQAVFGDRPSFVIAAGGFHPDFRDIPPGLPSPIDRLFAAFPINVLKIRIEAYFAVTPASIQAGANASLKAGLGPVDIEAKLGFDAICYLVPSFRFDVKIYGSASLKFKGHNLAGIAFEFRLEGPGRWRARGFGKFSILFWDIEVPFDESWGENVQVEQQSTSAQALIAGELQSPGNWTAQMPIGIDPLVNIARIDGGEKLLAHPLGTLTFTQNALPFDLELQRIGANRIEGQTRFGITEGYIGNPSASQPATPLQQHFALGEYRDLSDAEKLSNPSFQSLTAGARFGSTAYSAGAAAPDQDLDYETLYLEPEPELKFPFSRIRFRERAVMAVGMDAIRKQARQGAAAFSALRTDDRLKPVVNQAVSVGDARLAAASTETMRDAGIAFDQVTAHSPSLAADALGRLGAASAQVVEQFELA